MKYKNLAYFSTFLKIDQFLQYVAVIVSTIFAKITHDEVHRVQNIRGFTNIIVLETLYEFAYFVFNTFPAERPLMLREIGGGLYTAEAYYLSKLISKVGVLSFSL